MTEASGGKGERNYKENVEVGREREDGVNEKKSIDDLRSLSNKMWCGTRRDFDLEKGAVVSARKSY